jgi:hypothetical protein
MHHIYLQARHSVKMPIHTTRKTHNVALLGEHGNYLMIQPLRARHGALSHDSLVDVMAVLHPISGMECAQQSAKQFC